MNLGAPGNPETAIYKQQAVQDEDNALRSIHGAANYTPELLDEYCFVLVRSRNDRLYADNQLHIVNSLSSRRRGQ